MRKFVPQFHENLAIWDDFPCSVGQSIEWLWNMVKKILNVTKILEKYVLNSSCSRNLKHFGNPKKWKFAQKSQILWGKWISGRNVHKSADYWDTQFFLFSQKFHDQSVFQNCEKTEPGTIFLKICLDLAYSIDSKKGLTFENPTFNSWLISKTVFD